MNDQSIAHEAPLLESSAGNSLDKDALLFRSALETYLLPLFHSAVIEGPKERPARADAYPESPGSVNVAVPAQPQRYYVLRRNVPFTVQEKSLLHDILDKVQSSIDERKLGHGGLSQIIEWAIARQIKPESPDVVLRIMHVYGKWAAETYEGRRITHTIGICGKPSPAGRRNFFDFKNEGALKILGNTPDTILTLDNGGGIIGMETISDKQCGYRKNREVLAPVDMADIALWTSSANKVALRLLPNGEILIFKDKQLAYAKRRSYWRRFPHKAVLYEHFSVPYATVQENAKRAVYLTALDLAFSGRGGCLGILQTTEPQRDVFRLVNENALFTSTNPLSTTQLLSDMAGSGTFQEIPRRVRLGFCSLDGATLIDSQGTLLAAGALLRTSGNPLQGGGRSAAARTLAGYGYGIKISEDGFIEIHRGDAPPLLLA